MEAGDWPVAQPGSLFPMIGAHSAEIFQETKAPLCKMQRNHYTHFAEIFPDYRNIILHFAELLTRKINQWLNAASVPI
jgi:hypothetical protein